MTPESSDPIPTGQVRITPEAGPLRVLFDHMRQEVFIRKDLDVGYIVVEQIEDVIPRVREEAARAPKPELTEAEVAERM